MSTKGNRITIYKSKSSNILCGVCASEQFFDGDFTNYEPKLTVKDKSPFGDEVEVISTIGTWDSSTVALFNLTPEDTSIAPKDYMYDVVISDASINQVYTVVQDRFEIVGSVSA